MRRERVHSLPEYGGTIRRSTTWMYLNWKGKLLDACVRTQMVLCTQIVKDMEGTA